MDKKLKGYLEDAYWTQGKSQKQIAREMELTQAAVSYYFKKLRIRTRTHRMATKLGTKKWWKKRKEKEAQK